MSFNQETLQHDGQLLSINSLGSIDNYDGYNSLYLRKGDKNPSDTMLSDTSNEDKTNDLKSPSASRSTDRIGPHLMQRHNRTKLASKEVDLILYLIAENKPFKYIGNRNISQTKKWDLIQKRYGEIVMARSRDRTPTIPTVRTLQRQLSSAISHAKSRMKSQENTETARENLQTSLALLSPESSRVDLENALFRLNELSEKLKSGISGESMNDNQDPKEFHPSWALKTPDPEIHIHTPIQGTQASHQSMEDIRHRIDHLLGGLAQPAEEEAENIIELLEALIAETSKFHKIKQDENERLFQHTESFIRSHMQRFNLLLEENRAFEETQYRMNHQAMKDLVTKLVLDINGNKEDLNPEIKSRVSRLFITASNTK